MDAILETLYSTFAPDRVSEAERAIMEREGEFLDGVEERLSVEDFGHLWDVFLDMSLVRMEESFTLGYRLGAQLMLASLGTEEWAIDPQKRPYSWHSPVEAAGRQRKRGLWPREGSRGAPLAPFWVLFVRTKSTRGVRGRVAPEAIE